MTMCVGLASTMCSLPALDDCGGSNGEREIDDCEAPETAPIARHLPEARAHLIEPNDTVDRKIGWKDVARGLYPLGDGLSRPRIPGEEELRQAGAQKNEGRRLRTLEPGAHRLAQEAGCKNKYRDECDELQGVTERGES